jgi:hypothetical protein
MLNYSLRVYRGDTHRWRFFLWADSDRTTAVDLTGVTVAAEIRAGTGTTPVVPLTVSVTAPNQIDLSLAASAAASLPASAKWDLQLTYASGDVQTVVAGSVLVSGDITASVAVGGFHG